MVLADAEVLPDLVEGFGRGNAWIDDAQVMQRDTGIDQDEATTPAKPCRPASGVPINPSSTVTTRE